jgi:hypothetical protein
MGLPRPFSGNFADVYQVHGQNGQSFAVKCFTREVGALQARYQAISDHLRQGSPSFMVQFTYLAEGIRIRNGWYPILKMDWIEGFTLNAFINLHVDKPQVVYRLAQMWVKLSQQLRQANMAHCDLQHGNVLLVPGAKPSQLSLRLIDYDGMFIPALKSVPSGELGHPNYQHPQRLREGIYSAEVDRFSHLLIYTALRCLTVGGRELWAKYDNGENLLFRAQDFGQPQESQLLLDIWQLRDHDLCQLLGHLILGSQMPLERMVTLDQVVGGEGRPLALTTGQEHQLLDYLPPGAARLKNLPAKVSRYSLEELIAKMDEPLDGGGALPAQKSSDRAVAVAAKDVVSVRTRPQQTPPPLAPIKEQWSTLAWVVLVAMGSELAALIGLPHNEPGTFGLLGIVGALVALIAFPLAVGLVVEAGLAMHAGRALDLSLRLPSWRETCPQCGHREIVTLFACRVCGQMHWARLAAGCVLAVNIALLTIVSVPHHQAPMWWMVVATLGRWVGRLAGVAAAFALFIGAFEVWKLQQRLPPASRIRSPAGQMALLAATILPVICLGLLVLGLYARLLLQ